MIILTSSFVGSNARCIVPGSPPESTARRASSITGVGGHQTISFSSTSSLFLSSFDICWLPLKESEAGETRNRRQDRSWHASSWGIRAASWLLPNRERRSAAIFWDGEREEMREEEVWEENDLRERLVGNLGRKGRETWEEEEKAREKEKAMAKAIFGERDERLGITPICSSFLCRCDRH